MKTENLTPELCEAIIRSLNALSSLRVLFDRMPSKETYASIINLLKEIDNPEIMEERPRRRPFAGECRVINLSEHRRGGVMR